MMNTGLEPLATIIPRVLKAIKRDQKPLATVPLTTHKE